VTRVGAAKWNGRGDRSRELALHQSARPTNLQGQPCTTRGNLPSGFRGSMSARKNCSVEVPASPGLGELVPNFCGASGTTLARGTSAGRVASGMPRA
jgi:hypothetical protein